MLEYILYNHPFSSHINFILNKHPNHSIIDKDVLKINGYYLVGTKKK